MKILLINPGPLDDSGRVARTARELLPGLTLPYLAALIGPGHELRLIDDNVETVDPAEPADAVMLTAMTSRAERAYQLADEFRRRGVKTVMGGIHATLFPEEAARHVDAVAVGEAELYIRELIDDLAGGRLRPSYRADGVCALEGLPIPRYDLIEPDNYFFRLDPVQVSRGCPHRCRFCSVSAVHGTRHRRRPVGEVLADIKAARRLLMFVDDNLGADRDFALELFARMRGMGKLFFAQFSLAMAQDEALLRAAREAGCLVAFTGLETLDPDTLRSMNKGVNLREDPGRALDRLREAGIMVIASMIVGFDSDTEETMAETLAFLEKHLTPVLSLYILTPLPRTELRLDLERQGRLLPRPWREFDGSHVTFAPKRMAAAELEALYWRTLARFYSLPSIGRRLLVPPRVAPMMFNLMCRGKLKHRLQPMAGLPWRMSLLSKFHDLNLASPSARAAMMKLEAWRAGRRGSGESD